MVAVSAEEYVVNESDAADWDDLVRGFPDHTVFHTMPWLRTVSAANNVKPILIKVMRDGRCAALWPFLVMKKGPLRVLGSPLPGWSTAYLGPLIQEDAPAEDVVERVLGHERIRRHAYLACKMVTRRRPIDMERFGFTKVLDLETYIVDLTLPRERLWENLKSECRTRIRKAERAGVRVREECDDLFIDDYWRMSVETFAKSNIQPTHSRTFVVELWRNLYPARRVRAFSAFMNGERMATLVLPHDDHTMYYWGGASYAQYRDVPAHNLLHWHAINAACDMRLLEYDFISTYGGPGRFKKTFGPQTVAMATHWEHSQSKLMAALKRGYQTYLLKRRRISA
jgi:hypothetical protein